MNLVDYIRPRIGKVLRDPAMISRFIDHHQRHKKLARDAKRALAGPQAELRRRLASTKPVALRTSPDGPSVHALCGVRTLIDAITSLKSFYRFAPEPFPLTIHEDGSFDDAAIALVNHHFPGVRILRRAEASLVIEPLLEKLPLCREFRRSSVMGLKYFDFQHFSNGRPTVYIDSDILFHRSPDEIFHALESHGNFTNRYNEDVQQCYGWTTEQIRQRLGVQVPERPVNAGMVVIRIADPDWRMAEECLRDKGEQSYWIEQQFWAVDLARRGCNALSPDYDVCMRHAWGDFNREDCLRYHWPGRAVTSEHYCGGIPYRVLFYEHSIVLATSGLPQQ